MSLQPLESDSRVEWTPLRGMIKATVYGIVAAALLAAANIGASKATGGTYSQSMILFMAGAFLTTWILFSVVHWAAGMVGAACTTLVCVLAMLVFVVMQLHLAMDLGPIAGGAPVRGGEDIGQTLTGFHVWFSPYVLLVMVGSKTIMMGVCAWIRHDGSVDFTMLVEIAKTQVGWI
ncbi:hypothetical protein PHYC_03248 [Phycisphaerales bacterium]|nr:hypothetical protein PHYC_03248 [Phycisphaerales bacterium]